MKLTTKFSAGIFAISLGIVFAAVVAIKVNREFNATVALLGNALLPSISTFDGLEIDAHRTRSLVLEMLITSDKSELNTLGAELDSVIASSENFIRDMQTSGKVPTEMGPLLETVQVSSGKATRQAGVVKKLLLQHDLRNGKMEWRRLDLVLSQLENTLRDARESALSNADSRVTQAAETLGNSQRAAAVGAFLIFVLNAAILVWAYRKIAAPIQSLATELRDFEGTPNLNMRFSENAVSELGVISQALNRLMEWVQSNAEALKEQRDQIHKMATHDRLTNLPLWRLGRDRLELAMAWSQRTRDPIAIMFVDLDGFKHVNDTYGHDAGDCLLREIAERLKSQLRAEDTVARFGGDEFVVILARQASTEVTQHIASRIIEVVAKDIAYEGNLLRVGASIGIAVYPKHGEDEASLLAAADRAMYSVKRKGKNHYAFATEQVPSVDVVPVECATN